MKTQIYQDGDFVSLEYDNIVTGERTKRQFYAQRGSVYELNGIRSGVDSQVCYGLSDRGNTLSVAIGGDDLLATIRAEWPSYRRAMRAF